MIFRQFLHEQRSCASYLIGCVTKGVAAIVDPQGEPSEYVTVAERHGLRISEVLDTHVHADHLSAARELAVLTGARFSMGADAAVGFPFEPLSEGDVIDVGNRHIRVMRTPGHTPEHVCLFVDDWFVLTGDTLFVGDVGRVDISIAPSDSAELERRARELHSSLQTLLELPDHVEVYPGHYAGSVCGRGMDGKPSSTIGRERLRNDTLSLDANSFLEFQLTNIPPMPEDFHAIKEANSMTASDNVGG